MSTWGRWERGGPKELLEGIRGTYLNCEENRAGPGGPGVNAEFQTIDLSGLNQKVQAH